jgi:hypothetical protein
VPAGASTLHFVLPQPLAAQILCSAEPSYIGSESGRIEYWHSLGFRDLGNVAIFTPVAAASQADLPRDLVQRRQQCHRVKNVLALVSTVAFPAQEISSSMAAFVTALDDRIKSMATTHELLSSRRGRQSPATEPHTMRSEN